MNKFEEIMNGVVQNPTKEQINKALEETVREFKSLKDLNDFLTQLHPSDAYNVITNIVRPSTNMIVKREQKNKSDDYKVFQNITQEAKKMYDYERKNATIFDVQTISAGIAQQVCQQMYGIAVRMISKVDDELGRVEVALNTIEEHIGLSVTNFEEKGDSNDTTKSINEQRSKEATK